MLKIKEYVKAESLEQAYELNQKRTNCILGGMLWLKMSNRNVQKAIHMPVPDFLPSHRRRIPDRMYDDTP